MLIQPVSAGNAEPAVEFLTEQVTNGPAAAREHLANHVGEQGASLVAVRAGQLIRRSSPGTGTSWPANRAA